MFDLIRSKANEQEFLTNRLSLIINPVYILRKGLVKAIERNKHFVTGDVLDFGCGSKPYRSLFKNAKSYIGVDVLSSGHDHSRSLIDVIFDGTNLPFPNNTFDTVVSFEVFEHVFNSEQILSEISRVLKPEGHILVTTPFCWGEHEQPYDFARYTSFGMRSIMERNGFRVLSISKTNNSFLAISQMLISYISNHALPKGRFLGIISQLLVVFPLSLLTVILSKVLPQRYESFSNLVVLAEKSQGF